jgi:hypothetical protein
MADRSRFALFAVNWFVSVGIALVIGVLLGALAGFFGGWVDLVISRLRADVGDPDLPLAHHHCRVPEAKHLLYDDHHWTHRVVGMARFTGTSF